MRDKGRDQQFRDCPGRSGTVGTYVLGHRNMYMYSYSYKFSHVRLIGVVKRFNSAGIII